MKTKILISLYCFCCSFLFVSTLHAQKIEYSFGRDSHVIDSLKFVIGWYKKAYNQSDVKKMNLFAGIDYCDGSINLYISQYSGKDENIKNIIKHTNRFITVSKDAQLPVIFQIDVLAKSIKEKIVFINMNGYYLKIEKNVQDVWEVTRMNQTF